jgi:colanic acid biosynthesis glycosyl transferase WcaI
VASILFVSPYYPPEVGAAQVRISEMAERLVRRGHTVTVLTTLPNYPLGVVPPEYQHGARRREMRNGVLVVRVWSYVSPNKGFVRRILAQLSFGCLAPFLSRHAIGQPDVVIVESPPLFDAIAGRLLAWRKRCPYIFTVADIWPESAVQLGALRNRFLIWLAERLEWSTYRRAGAVWAVTDGIRQLLIQRGLAPDHVFRLTNGVDTAKFRPMTHAEARADLGWPEAFTVLYAGTIGLAHGLGTLVDAADRLRDHQDIRFVLVGEGAAKDELMRAATERGLTNVTFVGAQPHERMPVVIGAADVCLVSLRKVPLFEGALPSKMYEAMACARPILLAVDGEARQLIEREAGAALHVTPEDPAALVEGVLHLRAHPDEAQRLGQHGRVFVQSRFDREQLTAALEARLVALVGHNAPAPLVPVSSSLGRADGDRATR